MRHLDPCPCGGQFVRYATKTKGRIRTRYLKCGRCTVTDVERFRIDERGRPVFATAEPDTGKSVSCGVEDIH